ncbi:hypothetical protein EVA_13278 [gut metagenome]|uniref:Uncharacterized protein n=1 Tax=gut metagenome TaxID=749906 RepID=J9CF56_9ZZZZ
MRIRRPVQTRCCISCNVPAAPSSSRTRGLSWRRILFALPSAGARC